MGITRNELASLLKRIGISSNDEWKNKNEDENDEEQEDSWTSKGSIGLHFPDD